MPVAHTHHHDPGDHDDRGAAGAPAWHRGGTARRLTLALLIPAGVLTALAMALLWPRDAPHAAPAAEGPVRALGQVVAVEHVTCPQLPEEGQRPPGLAARCGTVTVRVTDGPGAGRRVRTDVPSGPGAVRVAPGDDVVLMYVRDAVNGQRAYSIVDHQRTTGLWVLAAAFALAVVAFGRWRGVTALAGLAVTFAVLLLFIVPAILDGRSPVLVAIVGSAAIMLSVLYLTHGFSLTTTVAVAGTLVSLTVTAALSAVATAGTHLSGVADETSNYLTITQRGVDMRGLLLAGIVIGALGVLDDVTVAQSATVTELALANPAYGFRRLYRAATRIGRAHIASVINTIVLAYAGAALPLVLLLSVGTAPIGEVLTGELIAQELVRSAVGTIGLIAAVPVTTALAAALAARHAVRAADDGGDAHDARAAGGTRGAGDAQAAPDTHDTPDTHDAGDAGDGAGDAGADGAGARPERRPVVADPWAAFVEYRESRER